jgi:hypothetical protein
MLGAGGVTRGALLGALNGAAVRLAAATALEGMVMLKLLNNATLAMRLCKNFFPVLFMKSWAFIVIMLYKFASARLAVMGHANTLDV